jgi:hypothetical protein
MKHQQKIVLRGGERIKVKAHATLDIQGWGHPEVLIETDLNVQKISHEKDELGMIFMDDCELKVPKGVKVVIDRAYGNARLRDLTGELEINRVSGNLAVQNTWQTSISKVSGNCLVQDIHDSLTVNQVFGNFKGKDVRGDVKIEKASGGIELLSVSSGADMRAFGDIRVSINDNSTAPIKLRSSADIYLDLPINAAGEFHIKSGARLTELNIGDRKEKVAFHDHVLLLGNAARKFDLQANGKVRITGEKMQDVEILKLFKELDRLWQELRHESSLRREPAAPPMGYEPNQEEIVQDSEEKIQQQKEAEMRVQQAIQNVGLQLSKLGVDPSIAVETEAFDANLVDEDLSAEERLVVMRMLQENKITLEEADRLLEALENSYLYS